MKKAMIMFVGLLLLQGCAIWHTDAFKTYSVGKAEKVQAGQTMFTVRQLTTEESLIYDGRQGNAVVITYKKYLKDFSRPAFSQKQKYELDENGVITCQRYKLKVLQADRQKIRFILLNDPYPDFPER